MKTSDNQTNENFYCDLLTMIPVGICIIQNNQIVYQNARFEKVSKACLGLPINQTYGCIHQDDVDKVKNAYQSISTGGCQSVEVRYRFYPAGNKRDVDIRWAFCIAKNIKHLGQPAILIGIVDHTKTKEKELLTNLKSRMVFFDQITSGMAHEIRNPLTAINSYAFTLGNLVGQELIDSNDLQLMQTIIAQIQGASDKIESVLKRLMEISRIGAPEMDLTDVNKAIEEVIDLLADTLQQNGVTLELSLAKQLPHCYVDSRLIQQVIMNLISNAFHAVEKIDGPKKVGLKSFFLDNILYITVSDSGPELPVNIKGEIIDPFCTSDFVSIDTGLGVVQKIIACHDGSIQTKDSEWGGAEFRIGLPIEKRAHQR